MFSGQGLAQDLVEGQGRAIASVRSGSYSEIRARKVFFIFQGEEMVWILRLCATKLNSNLADHSVHRM